MSKNSALCGCAVFTLLVQIYQPLHIRRNQTMKVQNEEKSVLRIRCFKIPEKVLNTKATNVMNMYVSLGLNFYFVCTDNKIYRKVYTW